MPRDTPSAQTATRPAPVGGWNARDSLAAMPPQDAILLDNWFPGTDRVEGRGGYAVYATLTGITKDVDSLLTWKGPTGAKLWAFAISGANAKRAFDCSTAGAKAADATFTGFGFTGTACRYSSTMFNNLSGFHLYIADNDGDHQPAYYSGATWTLPTITGVTPANLVHVNLYKFRLYFAEKGTLNLWYLGLDALQGVATKYSLGGYFNDGGYLVASGTWTVDAGDGVNDMMVAISSEGQVAVFQGDDPSSASSWQIVGVYKTAPPIGRNCFFRYGADLLIITTDGMYSLADLLSQGTQSPAVALTDKIRYAFQTQARIYGSVAAPEGVQPGWMAAYYPRGRYIFINIPNSPYTSTAPTREMHQYVMNVQTKQWARFTGQDARSWALYLDALYFGSTIGGNVYKADSALADNASTIALRCRQAYDYFDQPGRNKQWVMARPVMRTDADQLNGNLYIDTDFATGDIVPSASNTSGSGAIWDVAAWDQVFWDADQHINLHWQTYGGIGFCASLVVSIGTTGATVSWYSTDWIYRLGGPL